MKLEKTQILDVVAEHGCNAVIVTHLIDIEQKEAFSRSTDEAVGYYGYYGGLFSGYQDPGYGTERTTVLLATRLYDTESEALMWAAESKTGNVESERAFVSEVIRAFVRDLLEAGVIAPGR